MDYLEILRNDAKLAEEFDMLFNFYLLDGLEERDTAEGRCTFSLPGKAFGRDEIASYTEMDVWETVVQALGMPLEANVAAELQKFYDAASRAPLYTCYFHEDNGTVTESQNLFF